MKWALIISFVAITAVISGALMTYPSYIENKEKDLNTLDFEERGKGNLIYNSTCSTKCHKELNHAAIYNPDKYLTSEGNTVYPPMFFPTQFWFNFLQTNSETRCKGIKDLDARTKELLFAYLKHEASENDDNADIELKQFHKDIEQGQLTLQANEGAEVFNQSCKSCHSEHLSNGFTSIEWKYQIQNYKTIHAETDAIMPIGIKLEQLKSFLNKSSASNETDAKIIRNLLRKLRKTDSINNTDNSDDDENNTTFTIPEEISWHDLDWQYPYDKGLQGLLAKFPDKPIILELTNKYS